MNNHFINIRSNQTSSNSNNFQNKRTTGSRGKKQTSDNPKTEHRHITLIGKSQAKKGHRFIYQGPLSECRECKLKNICFNLLKGRRYEILDVRDKEHSCDQFYAKVRVVEVERVPFKAAIPKHRMIEGSLISFKRKGCENVKCEYRHLTHPPGLNEGDRIKILKITRELECEDGFGFKEAVVDFAD